MSNRSAYTYGDGFNHDFTDEDAFMLVNIASSPEHRLHTCRWVDNAGRCGHDIQGVSFPAHFRDRHGIAFLDTRFMKCQWEDCMECIRGNLFLHMQQKHLAWRYPCFNCGAEFPLKNMRDVHFTQCKATVNWGLPNKSE